MQDTEAAVGDLQVPQVDAQVVGGQVRLVVAVYRDGVDVVSVSVCEHTPRARLHHQVHGPEHGYLTHHTEHAFKTREGYERAYTCACVYVPVE